jgi:DNA-binding CsgD family transcriptional regulator/N-acetylneuraminic acid mutarotase
MAEYGETLSEREIEVLEQVATGATNRQIAQTLVVSVNTVKVHLRNIYTKMGVESRTEATLTGIRQGMVSVSTAETETLAADVPASREGTPADVTEALPPLPWPKRVALIVGLIMVALASVATWPRSWTSDTNPDTDVEGPGSSNTGAVVLSADWRNLAPMNTGRSRFAMVAATDGQLFAIGGETNGGVVGSIERYDPGTDQWTILTSSKPTRVSNISAALVGNRIFVPGGRTAEGKATTIVEVFDVTSNAWSEVKPLPRPVYTYALAVYKNKVYLFGGRNDRGYANSTFVYDPQKDAWKQGREMPTQRAYAAAATLGSRIFVVGGYDGQVEQPACEAYSPEEDTWETCEPLTLGRGGLGLVSVANRLYAVGGGWSDYLGFSEKYDPSIKQWSPFETPVSRRWHNLSVASTPSKFFMAGGWNGEYLNGVWEYVVLPYEIFIPAASP